MSYFKTAALIAVAIAASATPAVAQTSQTYTATVRYTDLDLTKPHDVAVLKHRVSNAVNSVCRDAVEGDMARWDEFTACAHQSASDARVRVAMAVKSAQERLAAREPEHAIASR